MTRSRINAAIAASAVLSLLPLCALAAPELKSSTLVVPTQARPGETITLKMKAEPQAPLRIDIKGLGMMQGMALAPKKADAQGLATWTLTVPKDYKADQLPVVVTVGGDGVDKKLITSVKIASNKSLAEMPLKFENLKAEALPGEKVTVRVKTMPGASVNLDAENGDFMPLPSKKADDMGIASWVVNVNKDYNANKIPLVVTSSWKDAEKKMISSITIQNPSSPM